MTPADQAILSAVDHALGLTYRVVTPPRSDFFGMPTDHGDATARLTCDAIADWNDTEEWADESL